MSKFRLLLVLFVLGILACHKDQEEETLPVGKWIEVAEDSLPLMRSNTLCFSIGDTAYVGLGSYIENQQQLVSKEMWKFNGRKWLRIADFPGRGRERAEAFVIGDKAYVGMGMGVASVQEHKPYYTDFWVYDSKLQTWDSVVYEFPGEGRIEGVAFAVGGKGYVGTGSSLSHGISGDMYEFDPHAGWVELPYMDSRKGASAFVVNDVAYVCFGLGQDEYLKRVERFLPSEHKWEKIMALQSDEYPDIRKRNASTFVIDNKVYFVAGSEATGEWETCRFDPEKRLWEKVVKFPYRGIARPATFTWQGEGYVVFYNKAWKFVVD